jgi:hypothetical protein
MKIGAVELPAVPAIGLRRPRPVTLVAAPMAGVTDRPFRMLCRRLGAQHAVSEMVTSRRELWASLKASRRADHAGEPGPVALQIAGVDPAEMADEVRHNVERGAQIIDINIGWALRTLPGGEALRQRLVAVEDATTQHRVLADGLAALAERLPHWPGAELPAAANDAAPLQQRA